MHNASPARDVSRIETRSQKINPRPRSLRRYDLPATKHSVRGTLAAIGLVLIASAATGLRAASANSATPSVERDRSTERQKSPIGIGARAAAGHPAPPW